MAVFAKDGVEVRILLRAKPPLLEPREPIYELEISSETEAQRKNQDKRKQKNELVGKGKRERRTM